MQVRISRPVVIATAAGLRHFAPGLVVDVSEAEAAQILRQKAGCAAQLQQLTVVARPADAKKTARSRAKPAVSPNLGENLQSGNEVAILSGKGPECV